MYVEDMDTNSRRYPAEESSHGDVTYGSFVNELESIQKKPQTKLSKNELAPFFEKQKFDK